MKTRTCRLLIALPLLLAALTCVPEVQQEAVRPDDGLDAYLNAPEVTPAPSPTPVATPRPTPIRESVINDEQPGPPVAAPPAPAARFEELRERIRKLAQEAVALSKQNKTEEAQAKIDEARMMILSFEGSADQRQRLTEEYDMLLTLLDELIEPERSTPGDAVRFILAPPEPSSQDIAGVEAARSIPSVRRYVAGLNSDARRRVAAQLAMFNRTTRGRKLFQLYLDRSARYRQHINRVLAKYNLPAELFCVALIESGFSETAVSRAGAAGMWQFMPQTGRGFDLALDRWVDERFDWVKATDAAARYLKNSLHYYHGNIELAVASYNTGAANVDRAVRRAGAANYWRLHLHPETMGYVPKWIAAMILYYDASRFGFQRPADNPVDYDSITIRGSVELEAVAGTIGRRPADVLALNRALVRQATPPDRAYELRLPLGTRDRLLANLDDLLESQSVIWIAHRVREGESPASIAKLYHVPVQHLIEANNLLEHNLPDVGEVVMVPVSPDNQAALAQMQRLESEQRRVVEATPAPAPPNARNHDEQRAAATPVPVPRPAKPKKIVYKVRPRDSLWTIADRYDVSVADLRRWNRGAGDEIHPGQQLVIYVGGVEPRPATKKYVVRRGDTLCEIASRCGVSVRELAAANGLTAESTIYPGMELSVPAGNAAAAAPPRTRTHIVRRGETLTGIATRYEVSMQNLMAWNNLADADALRPGQTLVLSADAPRINPQTVYTTRRGDTLAGVARRFHVSARDLAAANGLSARAKLRPGQKLKIPGAVAGRPDAADKWTKYKVRSGDTLARIAERHGCSIDDLAQWNNLRRNATLRIGQVIKIKVKKRT